MKLKHNIAICRVSSTNILEIFKDSKNGLECSSDLEKVKIRTTIFVKSEEAEE